MTLATLYLTFVVLPGLDRLFNYAFAFGTIATIFCAVGYLAGAANDEMECVDKHIVPKLKIAIAVACIGAAISAVTPNKEQVLLLTGAYAVTNSAELSKLPDNIAKAANKYLESLLPVEEKK